MSSGLPLRPFFRKFQNDNLGTIILAAAALLLGVIFGVLAVGVLDGEQKANLWSYLTVFLSELPNRSIDGHRVFLESIGENLKTAALLWVLGLSVLGVPVILVVLFLRGFILGFTVGFLVADFGWHGFLFSLAGVLLPALAIVPALVFSGAAALSFAFFLVKSVLIHQRGGWRELGKMTMVMAIMSLLFVVGGIYEGYLGPVLLRLLAGNLRA